MMERHKCKLCFKIFINGKALGGHMRTHLINLPVSEERRSNRMEDPKPGEETDSAPSSASEDDEGEAKDQGYVLRENPKKSIRLADPEFSLAGSSSVVMVVVQDRESETESSKKNPTRRRRSKRLIKKVKSPSSSVFERSNLEQQKVSESWPEPETEPVSSSISDVTTEEDVAFCLMMMSRDKWKQVEDEDEDEETEEVKVKYTCETCKKTFRSYQALGGHKASHRKSQAAPPPVDDVAVAVVALSETATSAVARGDSKVHECPYCFRVFASGQALGGHKRSHAAIYGSASSSFPVTKKVRKSFIDLNLPPAEEDDCGQVDNNTRQSIVSKIN